MPRKFGQTFVKALRAVGPRNAQVLEHKANTAALLAGSCPEHRDVLRALETKALDQVFRIVTSMANSRVPSRDIDKGYDCEPTSVRLAAD